MKNKFKFQNRIFQIACDTFGYWRPSHFACFDGGYVYVYVNGKSSFTEYITRKYLPNDVVLASRKDNKNEKSDN